MDAFWAVGFVDSEPGLSQYPALCPSPRLLSGAVLLLMPTKLSGRLLPSCLILKELDKAQGGVWIIASQTLGMGENREGSCIILQKRKAKPEDKQQVTQTVKSAFLPRTPPAVPDCPQSASPDWQMDSSGKMCSSANRQALYNGSRKLAEAEWMTRKTRGKRLPDLCWSLHYILSKCAGVCGGCGPGCFVCRSLWGPWIISFPLFVL